MAMFPALKGLIRRRILVNFSVLPEAARRLVPPRFDPILVAGRAIAGVCLIRLEGIRPARLPLPFGLSSENAAHRIAVRWKDELGEGREGVYIPRRDTGSLMNRLAGGRLFPGEHHAARFDVSDEPDLFSLAMRSDDGTADIEFAARPADRIPDHSVFESVEQAAAFFQRGDVGYSETRSGEVLQGVRLVANPPRLFPLAVLRVRAAFYEDPARFPPGSVRFDSAFAIRDLDHSWRAEPSVASGRHEGSCEQTMRRSSLPASRLSPA